MKADRDIMGEPLHLFPSEVHEEMSAPVSVIVPCYNCSDTIGGAVNSVMEQTLMPREIFLIDDGSCDGGQTRASLQQLRGRFGGKAGFHVLLLAENQGPSVARNTAWEAASQPFLAFLDADDAWHPKKLEIQYNWMQRHPEVALTGHSSLWVREEEPRSPLPGEWSVWEVKAHHLLLSNRFLTRCVMMRREIPYRFDPTKRYSEDYLLWLKIVLAGYPAWRLEVPLAYTYKADFGSSGLTGHLWSMEKGELATYWRLYRGRMISSITVMGLILLSLGKYFRRLVFASVSKRSQRR
jgi:teichuronic acid biosynthesis glycosyltransferase TuaG